MMKAITFRRISLFTVIFCLLSGSLISISIGNTFQLNESLKSPSNLFFLEQNMKITISNDDKYQDGVNMFGLSQGLDDGSFDSNNSYLAFTDMEGKFIDEPFVAEGSNSFRELSWVNESILLADYNGKPMLWNIKTNETEIFNFPTNYHDGMLYNPVSDTFLILDYFPKPIRNSSGDLEMTMVDQLTEYSRDGKDLWRWDFTTRTNLSLYNNNIDRLNISRDTIEFNGELYPDPMHANSISWDNDSARIYVNLRHLNQFVAINSITKEIEWIAGQEGNFTLYNKQNTEVESLWYHSSDVQAIGNNEFIIFDNNYHNLTDNLHHNLTEPLANFSSSILHIKLDPINETIHEIFRWEGPFTYTAYQWGSVRKLENGNYLAGFGAPIHSTGPNNPANHTSFGGVAVEITPAGEKVWEMRLPYQWGFKRIDRIMPVISVSHILSETVTVGTNIDLVWTNVFSNFPKTYKITVDEEVLLEADWNQGPIEYHLRTGGLAEGDHLIILTLTDILDNEKETATKITILYPNTSKKDDVSFLDLIISINTLLIIFVIRQIRRNGYYIRN